MPDSEDAVWYCLRCATENERSARLCRGCAQPLVADPGQVRQGTAFLLNELEAVWEEGAIPRYVYDLLRRRYREVLGLGERARAPTPAKRDRAAPPRRREAAREGPGWLAEQQANLLLYLGAFLIVIAMLLFVARSEEAISDGVKMALLALGTLAFLAAGLLCRRLPRVQQAGIVFFAVGALMVPLSFVGAYAFFFADEEIDATGLWLAGSLASALFYGAVSLLGFGRWYPVPAVAACGSALAATLVLSDAPPEAYPGSFIALALLFATPSMLPYRRVHETFGLVGTLAAHALAPPAIIAALALTGLTESNEPFEELTTRWYLPATGAIAAVFYWAQALWARRAYPNLEPFVTVAALAVTGGAAITLVFALDVGQQWYGPAVAIIGFLYALGSEGLGPRWFGQRHLGWLALGSVTVSWLIFEGIYADFSRIGAGVHFAAAAFYLGAARLPVADVPLLDSSDSQGQRPLPSVRLIRLRRTVPLVYASALTAGIGYYHLLASLPAAETAEASDLSLAFFGPSLAVAAIAATMRWWWPALRPHMYTVALGTSLFVLLSSVEDEGQVALLLGVYTAVALALVLWEREPLALPIAGAYGFFALAAAWRHYEPVDAYLPLALSGIGGALFITYVVLRGRDAAWAQSSLTLAFAYAVVAPVAGWIRLAILADPEGFVGSESFEETWLYQTSAASVFVLGVLVAAQSALVRRIELAAGASALMMVALLLEIGHFRPENAQAYTAPVGLYLLAGGVLAARLDGLPRDLQPLVEPLQAAGAAVLMGPSLVQSWQDGGAPYAVLVLAEGFVLLGIALVQRWLWLLGAAVLFVVLDALRYLFEAARVLPDWGTLSLAGLLLLAAGVAVLLGREQWTRWQRSMRAWWLHEPLPSNPANPH